MLLSYYSRYLVLWVVLPAWEVAFAAHAKLQCAGVFI